LNATVFDSSKNKILSVKLSRFGWFVVFKRSIREGRNSLSG